MDFHVANNDVLYSILHLERVEANLKGTAEVDLQTLLQGILKSANEFVPSDSGSILLKDAILIPTDNQSCKLNFVACFGIDSEKLLSMTIDSNQGVAGKTFSSGVPYISETVKGDKNFYPGIDEETDFETKSIICAPIKLEGRTIGIIELINKFKNTNYAPKDLTLLKIFAGYTSTLIQNSIDARTFKHMSIHDGLTGLYNDRYMNESLMEQVKKVKDTGKGFGVIFLDLDNFKSVNDTLGHLAGSRVLREVGAILRGVSTDKKVAHARYGGDEFVSIVTSATLEETAEYAEDIRHKIENYTFLRQSDRDGTNNPNLSGVITASIGVSSFSKTDINPSSNVESLITTIIKKADRAMYVSKESGKNKVTLSDGSLHDTSRR